MIGIPKTKKAYQLFHMATKALADVEYRGIRIDTDYLETTISTKTEEIKKRTSLFFKETELGKEWSKEFGRKAELTNNNQLASVLFDRMGFESVKETRGGKKSADSKTLQKLQDDLGGASELISLNKLEKGVNTFLAGIERETTGGRIHPMFSLNIPRSYRSSSQAPNFQNFPIRDPEIGRLIRNCFIPEDNWYFAEADYSGLEVHIGACYHGDQKMIHYLEHPEENDMHRDCAQDLFFLSKHQVTKNIRYCAKNGFVFAEFYGSYYKQVAKEIWDMIDTLALVLDDGTPLKTHLKKHGVKNLDTFTSHVQKVEDILWHERFVRYTEWKEEHYANYLKKGFFVSKTGFVYQGLMRRNQVINFPVQGSAFHCLLRSLIEVNRELRRRKMRSHLVGQIHDSMIPIIHPNEVEDVFSIIQRISCTDLRKKWDWITVPLKVEFDLAPQGKSWYYKQEVPMLANGSPDWDKWTKKCEAKK